MFEALIAKQRQWRQHRLQVSVSKVVSSARLSGMLGEAAATDGDAAAPVDGGDGAGQRHTPSRLLPPSPPPATPRRSPPQAAAAPVATAAPSTADAADAPRRCRRPSSDT